MCNRKHLNVSINFSKNQVERKTLNSCQTNGWRELNAVAKRRFADIGNHCFDGNMETLAESRIQILIECNMFSIFRCSFGMESNDQFKIAWILQSTSSAETS